jgi:hypothetical protein
VRQVQDTGPTRGKDGCRFGGPQDGDVVEADDPHGDGLVAEVESAGEEGVMSFDVLLQDEQQAVLVMAGGSADGK